MIVLPMLLAILLGLGFVALLLALGRRNPATTDGTSFTLRHSAILRWFSLAALFGGEALFALWVTLIPPRSEMMAWALIAASMLLGVVGLCLVWESFRWQLTVTPLGLDCRSPWKNQRKAEWKEVDRVQYSKVNRWYDIRFTDGHQFRVPSIVPGVSRFVDACKTQGKFP